MSDKGRYSLDSIQLDDFPENREMAQTYFDREFGFNGNDIYDGDDEEDDEEKTVIMSKSDFIEEEDFLSKHAGFFDDYGSSADTQDDTTVKPFKSEDIDAFLNDINQKLVNERNEAREAARWKPTPREESYTKGMSLDDIHAEPVDEEAAATKQPARRTSSSASGTRKRTSSDDKSKGTTARAAESRRKVSLNDIENELVQEDEDAEDTSFAEALKRSIKGENSRSKSAAASRKRSDSANGERRVDTRSSRHIFTEEYDEDTPRKKTGSSSGKKKKQSSIGFKILKAVFILIIWVVVLVVSVKLYNLGYDIFNDQAMDSADVSQADFETTGLETDEEMGEKLLAAGYIDDVEIFLWRCRIYTTNYRAGTFKLSKSYNTEKILNILSGYDYATGTMTKETTAETEETTADDGETTSAASTEEETTLGEEA